MKTKTVKIIERKVSYNKTTGQPSITLPLKVLKFLKERPKGIKIEVKGIKW